MNTTSKPDFNSMTGPQLVEAYNAMCEQAKSLGINTVQPTKRFSGLDAGRTRCERMWTFVADLAQPFGEAPASDRPAVGPSQEEVSQTQAATAEVSDVTDVSFGEMTGEDLRPRFKQNTEEPTPAAAEQTAGEEGDDEMAKKRKAKTARKRATNGSGENLHSYTERWNALVPKAVAKGIKGVKKHTSDFESYDKAKARVAWLEKAISKA